MEVFAAAMNVALFNTQSVAEDVNKFDHPSQFSTPFNCDYVDKRRVFATDWDSTPSHVSPQATAPSGSHGFTAL